LQHFGVKELLKDAHWKKKKKKKEKEKETWTSSNQDERSAQTSPGRCIQVAVNTNPEKIELEAIRSTNTNNKPGR
jgi:hypothetical protein